MLTGRPEQTAAVNRPANAANRPPNSGCAGGAEDKLFESVKLALEGYECESPFRRVEWHLVEGVGDVGAEDGQGARCH